MKKILLATDGSESSMRAARFLAHLPHEETMELTIVSTFFVPTTIKSSALGEWVDTFAARQRAQADRCYTKIATLFDGANVKLRQIFREGNPADTIVAVAKEEQAELIVLGATGHSAVARMLLGSTSDYVATHAPCSVLVVRPTNPLSPKQKLLVAIGYEESGPAEAALEEFAEFSWAGQTDVRVVSVDHAASFYDMQYESPLKNIVKKAAERIQDVVPEVSGHVVHFDHIGEGLVRYLEANNIDLAIVGETPRSRLGRVLMGSMTRFVLRHAPCSVWITRNRMVHGVKKPLQQTEATTT